MNPPDCIELDSVLCAAGGRELLRIEHLRIAQGERVAIIGHNGAGKSTLLKLLSGFMPLAHGRLDVLGRRLTTPMPENELRQLREGLGQVLQGLHLVARLSALDNVLIGSLSRIRGWRGWLRCYPAQELAQAEAALHAVGLLARARTRADQLSGGERQKVAIARMLMQRPRLILADEPTAALDPAAASEVCQLLARAAVGTTLITVVHNPALLPLLADRVIGLKQGRIVFDLPVAALDDASLMKLYRPSSDTAAMPWQLPANCSRAQPECIAS